MQPGPDEIRACPDCGKPFRTHTMLSGNTFGARYWSDGKCDAPMLPDYPSVGYCPHCRFILWVEDTTMIGEEDWFKRQESESPWRDARELMPLDAAGYLAAIGRNGDGDRERFLRVSYWQHANDAHRRAESMEDSAAPLADDDRANLQALLGLLKEGESASERLMKAEVFRELGQYREALWLLSEGTEEVAWAASQILAMAQAGVSRVFELRTNE
jgi:hypothetical protein